MTVPLKKRARHKLFEGAELSVNGGQTVNYDIEAIKLDRVRQAWPGCTPAKNGLGLSRLSISSEESLSDCEELGANHDNYHRESALPNCKYNTHFPLVLSYSPTDIHFNRNSNATVLWDERAIELSLRQFVQSSFEPEDPSFLDSMDTFVLPPNLAQWTLGQKNATLLWASWKSQVTLMASLLSNGAEVSATDDEGRTSLHLACWNANVACVQILLNHGAPINCFDAQKCAAPLFCAVASGCDTDSQKVVDLLLEKSSNVLETVNLGLTELGISALHVAVRGNAVAHVRKLLAHGASPNLVQLFSETPLHTAAAMGYDECVQLLIEHQASLEVAMGPTKMTALHLAAQDGNVDSLQLLVVEGGANVEAKNVRGQTALHLAALAQSPETVEVLLKAGKPLGPSP